MHLRASLQTGAHEENAPSTIHESDWRSTQHAITESETEASDFFQDEDAPMKGVEAHGGLSSRFNELW